MKRPTISFVVAMDRNGLIGAGNRLPWRLPEDMRRFRQITMGKQVLMGRRTYETIPARFRPLPGRTNIVLTQQLDYDAPGCTIVHSLSQALSAASEREELMVIGGALLYEQLLPQADRIYLTLIDGEFEGDVFFPALDDAEWQEIEREEHGRDGRHSTPFTFLLLERLPCPK
jgi:dihydrofolate reductase